MSNKFEIWVPYNPKVYNFYTSEEQFVKLWGGESFAIAVWKFLATKANGHSCVKLEYR